jgi:hypothetical protein
LDDEGAASLGHQGNDRFPLVLSEPGLSTGQSLQGRFPRVSETGVVVWFLHDLEAMSGVSRASRAEREAVVRNRPDDPRRGLVVESGLLDLFWRVAIG